MAKAAPLFLENLMLTQEKLKEVLRYEPDTGKFYWKKLGKMVRIVSVGDEAGSVDNSERSGYVRIYLDGKNARAHQLAWLHETGEWPKTQIDHINGIRTDNRICNLREANINENAWNAKVRTDNTVGIKGLSVHKTRHGTLNYKARVGFYGKRRSKYFPYTDDGKAQAIEWLQHTRANLHQDYARHK